MARGFRAKGHQCGLAAVSTSHVRYVQNWQSMRRTPLALITSLTEAYRPAPAAHAASLHKCWPEFTWKPLKKTRTGYGGPWSPSTLRRQAGSVTKTSRVTLTPSLVVSRRDGR